MVRLPLTTFWVEYTRFGDLRHRLRSNLLLLVGFSLLGFAVLGYHPGSEDDGIYLSAIKSDLNSSLYPRDAAFFNRQTQGTLFDESVAELVGLSHLSVPVMGLLLQFGSIVAILFACWRVAARLFDSSPAQWAGVALVAAMFTMPVSGTAIFLLDQHLHARTVATVFILFAVLRVMDKKLMQASILLLVALLMHPIMAAAGVSFCFFLALATAEKIYARVRPQKKADGKIPEPVTAALPLWIFEKPSALWQKALNTRTYYFLYKWTWYEWLGAIGPIVLFGLLWRWAEKQGRTNLARFALAVLAYGLVQQAFAMAILAPVSLVRLTPFQPMRYLQLEYLFMLLIGGCLIGEFLLKRSVWRWGLFLMVANAPMYAAQRAEFPASPHIEWPGAVPANDWLQAFAWISSNTPTNAYFALDPHYMEAPGEDFHSFRALAERSQLCDAVKDSAVVTQVPDLAPEWNRELEAQSGWAKFQLADFERLKREFGVNWLLVSYPEPKGLDCRWHNRTLAVCVIP